MCLEEMFAPASISLIDGLICTLTQSIAMLLGTDEDAFSETSRNLSAMNIDAELKVVVSFLEVEASSILAYKPAAACSECIQHTAKKIRDVLCQIQHKIAEDEQFILRNWYGCTCESLFYDLSQNMKKMRKHFDILTRLVFIHSHDVNRGVE